MLLAACVRPPGVLPDEDSATVPDDTAPPVQALLEVAPAFDPILGGPLNIGSVTTGAESTAVTVLDADGQTVAAVTDSWDGRDEAGEWMPVGSYTVRLEAQLGTISVEQQAQVQMVRCGVTAAWLEGDGGTSAEHVPLYWHASRSLQGAELPLVQVDSLEDDDDEPTELRTPGDQLEVFPDGGSLPTAFTWDSLPILTLELGDDTVLGSSGLPGSGVYLQLEGWDALAGAEDLDPAVPALFQATDLLLDGPGVAEPVLELSFRVDDEAGTSWELGRQELPLRIYGLLERPTWDRPEDLYTAWVAAVDPALRAIHGVEPQQEAVLDALVEFVYYDLGLEYDTRYGAAYYTSYQQGWQQAVLNLSALLAPNAGSTVNCSDCASILAAWANMLGVELAYSIVLQNFDLNYIMAIGGSEFTHCPFGSWGCSFSYHAVATNDGAATIWDATLALDGDADPGNPPSDTLLVQSIDGEEYLDRLVMRGNASYNFEGVTWIQ